MIPTVSENKRLHGLELHFPDRPPPEVREALLDRGWRYNSRRKVWWIRESGVSREFAAELMQPPQEKG